MGILERLKSIFEGKFGDIFANNTIKLFDFSRNTNHVLELREGQKIGIDLSKATEEEKKRIKSEILDFVVQNENDLFLTEKIAQKTDKIKRNLPEDKDKEILSFYREKLKPQMYKALEGALIVRRASLRGEDITELKRDIAYKYPSFGNNICNLTTGNYFDKYFKEMFQRMVEEEDFNILSYQEEVERIVLSLPYMVFISKYKSYEEFSGEVKFKLDKLRKYGTEKLNIHGLGTENVETALRIAHEYKNDGTLIIEKFSNKSRTIITVAFRFVR